MALEEAGVKLVVEGANQFESQIRGANDAFDSFGGIVQNVGGRVGSASTVITGALLHVGTIAVDAALQMGQALIGFGADSLQVAADYQSTLNTFASVTGDAISEAGMEIEDFSDLFLEMGAVTQFSAGQAAQAAVELAKGGLDPATIAAGGLESALGLAAAGALDLTVAAEITAKQLGVWSSEGVTAANVADLMSQAANASTVGVEELALGMANVGGVAKVTGATFQDTVQTLALLAPGFSSAADAGTSLKTFLSRLVPSTDKAREAFEALGLATAEGTSVFFDATGSFVGMEDAAQLLQDALAGMGEEQKLATLSTLFGSDAIRAAAMIAEAGAEGFNAMGEAMAGAGTAAEQAAKLNQGFNFSLDSLKGSIETIQIVIGSLLLPILTDLINVAIIPSTNAFLAFVQALSTGEDPIGAAANLFYEVANALGLDGGGIFASIIQLREPFNQFVSFIQTNIPLVQATFTTVFTSLQGMFTALSDFVTVTLMPAIASIWEQTGIQLPTTQQTFESVMAGIVVAVQLVSDFITNVLVPVMTAAVDWVVSNWPQIQATAEEVWAQVQAAIATATDYITNILGTFLPQMTDNVQTTLAGLTAFWDEHGAEIMAIVTNAFESMATFIAITLGVISATVTTSLTLLSGAIAATMQIINGDWSGAWDTITETIVAALDGILAFVDMDLDSFRSSWTSNWEMAKTIVSTAWTNMGTAISDSLTTILANIVNTITAIVDNFRAIDWVAVGSALIDNIGSGIANAAGGLAQRAADAAWNAYQSMLSALGMHSPSPMLRGMGKDTQIDIAWGIKEGAPIAEEAARNAARAVGFAANDALESAFTGLTDITQGAGEVFDAELAALQLMYGESASAFIAAGAPTSGPEFDAALAQVMAQYGEAMQMAEQASLLYSIFHSQTSVPGVPAPSTGGRVGGPPMPHQYIGPAETSVGGSSVSISIDARGASPTETQRAVTHALQEAGQYSDTRLRLRGAM